MPWWTHRAAAVHRLQALLLRLVRAIRQDDRGMSTVEYAIGTLAAAAFAAVLYTVVSGDSIVTALTGLVQRALQVAF
jgi:Flp pilus assembly pilin Flp